MTDTEKNSEDKAATKPKSAAKKKTAAKRKTAKKAKPKASGGIKVKAETETMATTKDVAPYINTGGNDGASGNEPEEKKSFSTMAILIIVVALVLATIYKFNQERGAQPKQAEISYESAANLESASVEQKLSELANNVADMQAEEASGQVVGSIQDEAFKQRNAEALERMTKHKEMMLQRRQTYEKEMQERQQKYNSLMRERRQEVDKLMAAQREEFQQFRQKQMETRKKIDAIHEQIAELHQQIRQIMSESHPQR